MRQKYYFTICRPSSSIASSQSLMAAIGETLMVEKATGKRVAKHQAADRILYQYIYHDTHAKWYRKYSVKFKPLLHLSF